MNVYKHPRVEGAIRVFKKEVIYLIKLDTSEKIERFDMLTTLMFDLPKLKDRKDINFRLKQAGKIMKTLGVDVDTDNTSDIQQKYNTLLRSKISQVVKHEEDERF